MPLLKRKQSEAAVTSRRHPVRSRRRGRGRTHALKAGLPSRALCAALAVMLLSAQAPAAPRVLGDMAGQWRWELAFWLQTGGPERLLRAVLPAQARAARQERQEERDTRVVRLKVSPERVNVPVGAKVFFDAIALDREGAAVGGVHTGWESADIGSGTGMPISPDGVFTAVAPGRYRVTASGAGKRDHVDVTVTEPPADGGRAVPKRAVPFSTRELPRASAGPVKDGAKPDRRKRPPEGKGAVTFTKAAFNRAGGGAPAPQGGEDLDGWNHNNYMTADDPGSQVGNPPGSPIDGGAGNGNFQLAAPVAGLSGRGEDLSLTLFYNAHLWHKDGANITYDIDRGWPAPGWSLGFGKMIDIGNGGTLIIEPDGTRHGFNGSLFPTGGGAGFFTGHTTDGSLIDYTCAIGTAGLQSATAQLPNGTVIEYAAPGAGALYPTRILDANGNYISVTYRNNTGPQIETVSDTLGRAVTFKYDENNLLTSVTAPGLAGAPERVLVRLHYRQTAVTANFTGLTARVRDAAPWAINAVYYPATGTGYWFGDDDSYLAGYGLIAKVVEQRGMVFNGDVTQPGMGSVTQGTMTREYVYRWLTPASDVPGYDRLTERWDGMDTDPAVTSYEVRPNDTPRTTTITHPTGAKSVQYSYNAQGQFTDGLVYMDETYDDDGTTLLARSRTEWQQGDYESPRPRYITETVRVRDGAEITKGVEYTYAASPSYNQVIETRSYGYGYVFGGSNTLLRRAATQYENSSNYTGSSRHIYNLPKVIEVYGGDGVRVSRAEYEYDGGTLANTPNAVHHDHAFDPYAPVQLVPGYCYPNCGSWGCSGQTCVPDRFVTSYKPETNYRGNVTRATVYSNAAAEPAEGPVVETRTYDMTGNMLTVTASCCEQTSYTYNISTQYAYPTSNTRGSSDPGSPLRITTSAAYDFNTGLTLTATDANGRVSQTNYFAATLRPQEEVLQSGARTTYVYDDAAMKVTQTTLPSAGGAVAAKSVVYLNGAGQVKREEVLAAPEASSWESSALNVVETKYDVGGRPWKQSRPFRNGEETGEFVRTTTYDALGRVLSVVGPDGSTTQAFYNDVHPSHPRPDAASAAPGETALFIDPWGRERWGRTDAQGQLVEVVEPNPDGAGGVATGGLLTTYSYDTLGRLTEVGQGAQHRRFAYDSLGRLTRQKPAEVEAVFDETGQYVGRGGQGAVWSDLFDYDARSNLVSHTDARNVRTKLSYKDEQDNPDPLNRLMKVEYVVQTGSVPAADTVLYAYETTGDQTRLNSITTKDPATAEVSTTEEYRYDAEARVDQKTQRLASRPLHPLVTNYIYDSLDRLVEVIYPKQYPSETRKTVHHDYDVASRLSGLTFDGAAYASEFVYNAASQTKQLKIGADASLRVTEKYVYDPATGLLAEQKTYRGSNENENRLLHLSYDYLRPGTNAGRTGQLTKITDNLSPEKGRTYSYDAVGRLKHVAGGDPSLTPQWAQDYSYDRYGNRTGVTASGNSWGLKSPAYPSAKRPEVELAANTLPREPEYARGGAGRDATDAPTSPLMSSSSLKRLAAAFAPGAPSNLTVTGAAASQVGLSWGAPAGGAHHYEVERGSSLAGPFNYVGSTQGTAFDDTSVTSGAAYLYRVRAVDAAGARSASSNIALGAAFTFTDETLTAGVTLIQAQHVGELRQAVNAVRAVAGLAPATWTDATLTPRSTRVSAVHIQELRDRLNEALSALQMATPPFTDPALSTGAGGTPVRRAHIAELRQRARSGQGAVVGTPSPVPTDGHESLSYDAATNRISAAGWEYDAAGNQTRVKVAENVWNRYEYDAANRLVSVKSDDGSTVLASYTYCYSNGRLSSKEGATRTYYAWSGGSVVAEYTEAGGSASPQWSKSYVYMGTRLLATQRPNGAGGERVEYHHPDRLGTRVVSNGSDAGYYEQTALPFGTTLTAGENTRRFTSYDRSAATGLDYAVNRSYDPRQGRFTQVDPIGIAASSLSSPQTLNLYAYCGNDPVNHVDPGGLFWGKLFKWIARIFKIIIVAVAVAVAVVAVLAATWGLGAAIVAKLAIMSGLLFLSAFGPPKISMIIGLFAGFYAITGQLPKIIVNLAEVAHKAETVRRIVAGLVSVGSITLYFQGRSDVSMDRDRYKKDKKPPDPGEQLTPCVKNILSRYGFDQQLLDKIRLHYNSPVFPGVPGVTVGNDVYFTGGSNQHSVGAIAMIAHETKHAQQYADGSLSRLKYAAAVGRTATNPIALLAIVVSGPSSAQRILHDLNEFEIPANNLGRQVRDDLMKATGGKDPCP